MRESMHPINPPRTQRAGLICRIRKLLRRLKRGTRTADGELQFSMLGCSLPEYERLWRGSQTDPFPNNTTHHLTFAEAQRIADLTGDYRMLQAWAHQAGFLLVKAPEGNACDMAVLEQVVSLGVANGQFMQTIHAALADGVVDQDELRAIREAQRVVQTAAATLTKRVEGMAE